MAFDICINFFSHFLLILKKQVFNCLFIPFNLNTLTKIKIIGREYECERILNGLQKIMELSIAEPFNYPVDLDSFPTYAIHIDYPIDLNTIRERLSSLYYRRVNSIQWDVRKIEQNASRYNEPRSEIVKKATLLCEVLLEFVGDPECTNPMPIYKRLDRTNRTTNNQSINASGN